MPVKPVKILCVEDDEGLATLLQQALTQQHYQVELATDGQTGWRLAETETYDLILLDWVLPKLTGIEFCQQLRTEKQVLLHPNRETPVLLMTAMDAVTHKVRGLNAGADDYVVKPFDFDELLARMRALLRRGQKESMALLHWGELCVDPNRCAVTYQGQPLALATKEYELLALFLRNAEQIFSLERLLNVLWSVDEMPEVGTVRTHIKGLRQKLKRAGVVDPIETLYKLGYRLKPSPTQGEGRAIEEAPDTTETETSETDQSSGSLTSVPPELWEAWQEVRESYRKRLLIIQQAVTALQQQTLTPDQQQAAAREAHTLVGSLGSFGLESASQIARQIQTLLKQAALPAPAESAQLLAWVAALWLELGYSEDEQPATIAASSPTLLIVDHDLPWAQALATAVLASGGQAEIVTTLTQAQQRLQTGAIQAMLLNLDYADANGSGLDWLATIQVQYPALTVMTLTTAPNLEQRLAAARFGSRCFLTKPIAPAQVLAAIAPVLQPPQPATLRLLVVDADPIALQFLGTLLATERYRVTLLGEPAQFWSTLEQTTPDLLLLAVAFSPPIVQSEQTRLPAFSGIDLCQIVRSDPAWQHLPVVFLAASTDSDTVQRCFAVGADEVLSKPVEAQTLLTWIGNRLAQRHR